MRIGLTSQVNEVDYLRFQPLKDPLIVKEMLIRGQEMFATGVNDVETIGHNAEMGGRHVSFLLPPSGLLQRAIVFLGQMPLFGRFGNFLIRSPRHI
ncbi:hypothetical protein KTH_00630 [Thermosporothrix hazakensis]|nr:hypothetical protein KTH_00630 [Thermosporothrix hazakensis]